MEGQPCSTNGVSKIRGISCRTTEELGADHKINGRSTEGNEEAVQQEKTKSSRIESWRQHVGREQEYPIKLTLKEAEPKEIQAF